MRQRRTFQLLGVVVTILVMSVGYAAIQNVDLTVTGNVIATPDQTNFKVAFTGEPTSTGTGTVDARITGDLTAIMNVSDLKAVGDTLTAKFTIANTSTDITAYLSNTVTNVNTEYFEVTSSLDSEELAPQTGTTNLNISVKLIKTPVTADQTDTLTVVVTASPTKTVSSNPCTVNGGHTYGEWTTVTVADCETLTNGSQERTCSVCGEKETEVVWYKHSHWYLGVGDPCTYCGAVSCGHQDSQYSYTANGNISHNVSVFCVHCGTGDAWQENCTFENGKCIHCGQEEEQGS